MESVDEQNLRTALALHQRGRKDEALDILRRLQAESPGDPGLSFYRGAMEVEAGHPATAVPLLESVLAAQPDNPEILPLLGAAYRSLGENERAAELWRRRLARDPADVRARFNLAEALLHAGAPEQAEREARRILSALGEDSDALLGLGLIYHSAASHEAAIGYYRRSLELRPGHAETRQNLAAALQEAGAFEEAERIYGALLDEDPGNTGVLKNLGTLYKDRDDLTAALEFYGRAMRLRRRRLEPAELETAAADPANRRTSLHSLRLEAEQLEHIFGQGIGVPGAERLLDGYRGLIRELEVQGLEGRRITLSPAQFIRVGEVMQRLVHLEPAQAPAGGVLHPGLDTEALESRFLATEPGIVVADDFLSPEALGSLRAYCRLSTIWFAYGKARGYCGAYMQEGFGNPLLLALAAELRRRMPRVVGPHVLNQMWAYIYDQRMAGITAHADPAAINLNFWIVPDEANLDPERGGLVVGRQEAPREWNFDEYNNRPEILERFIAEGDALRVPYRCNRMVMFNSNLVHKTDDFRFAPGFTNRRINVTMLFGRRPDS